MRDMTKISERKIPFPACIAFVSLHFLSSLSYSPFRNNGGKMAVYPLQPNTLILTIEKYV